MADNIKSAPLPGWEATNDGAADSGCQQRALVAALNAIGAPVLYWGNRRFNKISDRERVIRDRIRQRRTPRRARRQSHHHQEVTA
jgi:hypothetical protein